MDSLPLDTSHPAVREYIALTRLQVLSPLSLLLSVATLVVCATLVSPGISSVAHLHPTSITPSSSAIASYVGLIFLGQVGYCLLLVMARKPETKRAAVQGVGFWLVFGNFVFGLWAIAWIMQFFLLSAVLQGILLTLLLFSNLSLLIYHKPTSTRPLDMLFIHAPLRFFLILPMNILFPLCLFITLHLTFHPTPTGIPQNYNDWHATAGLAVVLTTNLFSLFVILLRHDVIWCIAATWIAVSIWSARPKPSPVYITTIAFTALHPLALIISTVYHWLHGRSSRGRVALLPDDEHPGLYATDGSSNPHGAHSRTQANDPPDIERSNNVWVGS